MNQNIRLRAMLPKERHDMARRREKEAETAANLSDRLEAIERTTLAIASLVGIDTDELEGDISG